MGSATMIRNVIGMNCRWLGTRRLTQSEMSATENRTPFVNRELLMHAVPA